MVSTDSKGIEHGVTVEHKVRGALRLRKRLKLDAWSRGQRAKLKRQFGKDLQDVLDFLVSQFPASGPASSP